MLGKLGEVAAGPLTGGAEPIGVGKYGRNAIEFLGQIEQSGLDFEVVGYLTYINLFSPPVMWTNGDPVSHKVKHARFPFAANLTGVARSWKESLFAVTASGDVRFFYNKPGGSTFDDPGTFPHGVEIASGSIRVQNTVDATGPEDGLANGSGEILLGRVSPFSIDGKQYQLGNKGLHYRIQFSGFGMLLDPDQPHAVITVAGNGFILRS